jgi:hypothetical protein
MVVTGIGMPLTLNRDVLTDTPLKRLGPRPYSSFMDKWLPEKNKIPFFATK